MMQTVRGNLKFGLLTEPLQPSSSLSILYSEFFTQLQKLKVGQGKFTAYERTFGPIHLFKKG